MDHKYGIVLYNRIWLGIKEITSNTQTETIIVWSDKEKAARFSSDVYAQDFIENNGIKEAKVKAL